MKGVKGWLILWVGLTLNLNADQQPSEEVAFSNAWVKMPMPGMNMTAGFVDLKNLTNVELRVTAVKTPYSAMSELHEMVMANAVMQMRHVPQGWVIVPGATLSLVPGGKHAMLMGINPAFLNQTMTLLEFNIEGIGWVSVPAVIKKTTP